MLPPKPVNQRGLSDGGAAREEPPRAFETTNARVAVRPALAGWARVDTDHVIRGWATDRNDRDFHPAVLIQIDGATVADLIADRLDPKLVELGEAHGRYGFAFVIPARFRDGQPHAYEVRTRDGDFVLKTKANSFFVAPEAATPVIELDRVGYGRIEGRLLGQYSRPPGLDLWGEDRLLETIPAKWSGVPGSMSFVATFDPRLMHSAERLRVAAPGMVEAGIDGAEATIELATVAEHDGEGRLNVAIDGDIRSLRSWPLQLQLYEPGASGPVSTRDFVVEDLPLEIEAPASKVEVRIAIDGRDAPWLSAQPRRRFGKLLHNGSFERWAADGPDAWTLSMAAGSPIRGYHAFSPTVRSTYGASGDLLRFESPAYGRDVVLIRQGVEAVEVSAGDLVAGALLVRTSRPAELTLRMMTGDGQVLGAIVTETDRAWAWSYALGPLQIVEDGVCVEAELSVSSDQPIVVEIAGARLGAGGFRNEAEREIVRSDALPNAVENAQLHLWPHGVYLRRSGGRHETAQGWFVVNRRTPDPVIVSVAPSPTAVDRSGFLFATPRAPTYCRLEVRLEATIVAGIGRGLLSFEAGSTSAARRLLADVLAAAPEFLVVDRILVVRRSSVPESEGVRLVDQTLTTIARKVLVTREAHRFAFPISLDGFQPNDAGEHPTSYFLVFEIRGGFAMALWDLRLAADHVTVTPVEEPFLALEDRNIAVQADHVLGLDAWLSPIEAKPLRRGGDPPNVAPVLERWRWSAASAGSVEIVVCVYNAAEEALACLASLIGSSAIPHTVRIVDDGSDAEVARRLDAFVADKPWMRVTHNPTNLGYTASADMGVRESDADWVVVLNSDTIVTPGWLEGMLETACSEPDVGFVGPLSNAATFQSVPDIFDGRGGFAVNELPDGVQPAEMAAMVRAQSDKAFPEAPLLNGFCTLMKRAVFLELGGLNRAAFPSGYGEENDLCIRATKAGYKLLIADHVYVFHSKSASFGSVRRAELSKVGSRVLRELHPDVDFAALTARFRDLPELSRLRASLRERLKAGA